MYKTKPFISVVITAYNRRDFLMQAIKSVLNQTLDRDLYDITVIKNFRDREIDDFCKKKKIDMILTKKPMTIGQYLHLGFIKSSGEIVTFLEDDDLFKGTKLRTIYDLFNKNEDLVYYHNAFEVLNYNGKILEAPRPYHPVYVKGTKDLLRLFPLLMSVEALNCNSAITLRKRFLKSSIHNLTDKRMRWMFDSLLFFLSARTDKLMMIDSECLTYYRRHKLKSKVRESGASDKELFEYFKNDIIYCEVLLLNDIENIDRIIRNSECRKCLDYFALERKLRLYFADRGKTAKMSKREYLLYLNYILKSKQKLNKIGFLGMHLASRVMPDPILRLYYERAISQFD